MVSQSVNSQLGNLPAKLFSFNRIESSDGRFSTAKSPMYVINELAKDPHTCVMKETGDGRGQSILNCMGFGKRLSREDIEKLNNSELIDLWTNHLFYV